MKLESATLKFDNGKSAPLHKGFVVGVGDDGKLFFGRVGITREEMLNILFEEGIKIAIASAEPIDGSIKH